VKVSAIEVYARAVAAEQVGDLDTALQLYRSAFRKYDAIDKLWKTAEAQALHELETDSVSKPRPSSDSREADVVARKIASLSLAESTHAKHETAAHASVIQQAAHTASITGTMEKILRNFPPELRFEMEELAQERSATIGSLPDEIMIKILLRLSPQSVERFAAVSRKARVVTLDSVIWR
jgi:F-box protein 9